jgi:hypothetical protein
MSLIGSLAGSLGPGERAGGGRGGGVRGRAAGRRRATGCSSRRRDARAKSPPWVETPAPARRMPSPPPGSTRRVRAGRRRGRRAGGRGAALRRGAPAPQVLPLRCAPRTGRAAAAAAPARRTAMRLHSPATPRFLSSSPSPVPAGAATRRCWSTSAASLRLRGRSRWSPALPAASAARPRSALPSGPRGARQGGGVGQPVRAGRRRQQAAGGEPRHAAEPLPSPSLAPTAPPPIAPPNLLFSPLTQGRRRPGDRRPSRPPR